MPIRFAEKGDVDVIVKIAESTDYFKHDKVALELIRSTILDLINIEKKDGGVLVYEDNGEMLGFISYRKEKANVGVYWVSWFAVRKDVQRRGIGTLLMQELEKIARAYGARLLLVDTSGDDEWEPARVARRFYEKMGFKRVCVIPRYYWDEDSAVIYVKYLK